MLKAINRELEENKLKRSGKKAVFYIGEAEYNEPYVWDIGLVGPKGTVYEGRCLLFTCTLHTEHPYMAPKISTKQKIYHPCVGNDGYIGLYYLKNWGPFHTIAELMNQISYMLQDPNMGMVKQLKIHRQWLMQPDKFREMEKEWVEKYLN